MKANELLLWLSARREGSWQQFRQAIEELHSGDSESDIEYDDDYPLHQRLRQNFEGLAHAEFFSRGCEKGWRIAPPVWALHTVSDGIRGVLCGARSPALIEKVLLSSDNCRIENFALLDSPDVIRIWAPKESDLLKWVLPANIHLQLEAPLAILWHLRACDPPSGSSNVSEYPQGKDWTIQKFDSKALKWQKIDRGEEQSICYGVLRFRIYFQREQYFLRWNKITFGMPRATGLYALLRHHRRWVVHYDRESRCFSVPAICRPPRLLERALVLCSGFPPVYADSRLNYSEVPFEIAKFAAELLRQPLA